MNPGGAISRARRVPGVIPPGSPGLWFGNRWFGIGWFGNRWFR